MVWFLLDVNGYNTVLVVGSVITSGMKAQNIVCGVSVSNELSAPPPCVTTSRELLDEHPELG